MSCAEYLVLVSQAAAWESVLFFVFSIFLFWKSYRLSFLQSEEAESLSLFSGLVAVCLLLLSVLGGGDVLFPLATEGAGAFCGVGV